MQIRILVLICLLALAGSFSLRAQPVMPFRTAAEAAEHQARFVAAAERAGYTLRPTFFYRNQLDITKARQLHRVGVDLPRMDREMPVEGIYDYPTVGLVSSLAVHGTIIRAVGDSSRRAYYHSAFTVRVAEVWQGHAPADTVVVRLRSGPLRTGHLYESGAPELEQGQEVVLFLDPIDFAGFAEAEKEGLLYEKNNAAPGDFNLTKAIKVKEGRIFGGKVKLARARRYTRHIAAILDKEHFYEKEF